MSQHKAIKRVQLGLQHLRPGRTKHSISNGATIRDFSPFVALEIATFPGDSGYYLLHISENGEVADTWHETVEAAMHQAEFEFEVREEEWTDVS